MNMDARFDTPGTLSAVPQGLAAVQAEALRTGRRTLDVLEETLALPARDFANYLGDIFHYPVLTMDDLDGAHPAFDTISFTEAARRECLLLRDAGGKLMVVVADPFDGDLQEWAEERLGVSLQCFLAHRSDVAAYLARHEESLRAMDTLLPGRVEEGRGNGVEDLSLKTISEDTSQVVKLVHSTLYDALKSNVSDIHLETGPAGLCIKYRIDGVLTTVSTMHGRELAEQVTSRIKVMAELDIAESRVPQDGRFKVSVRGREVDFRVSIMPSIHGEDTVLRILDKEALADQVKGLRLDHLGFDAKAIVVLRRLAREPYGMLLVTGPTGSGKTTTLYAAISEVNHGQDKIITIEDPVEYQLPGVLQIPVNEKKGLTFARGLRSILRHDPDKIMVGEIRDPDTAQIAVQSALTGHLVFTTVHANNVFDVIGRFTHMGVDPYSFVSALNGILAQRLVRLNCPACTQPALLDPQLCIDSGISAEQALQFNFRAGRGCGACRGTGYKGRKAIAEVMLLNDEIRELIVTREPIRKVKEAALKNGTRFLREAGLDVVRRGETTLQEINRVTFVA